MPQVACPGCQKTYKVPDGTSAVATCKACGKKFRIGAKTTPKKATTAAKVAAKSTSPTKRKSPAKPKPPQPVVAAAAKPAANDSFWDDALDESFEVEAPANETVNPMATAALAAAEAKANKPVKKVRWGFQWEKFFAGLAAFVLGGGAAAFLIITTGRINRLTLALVVVAFGGVFTMISGLMGEEGIW